MDALRKSVMYKCKESATLCVKSTVTIYDRISSSPWLEAHEPSLEVTSNPAPILKYLQERKKSDLIIECEGVEFPVHSLVLGCEYILYTSNITLS